MYTLNTKRETKNWRVANKILHCHLLCLLRPLARKRNEGPYSYRPGGRTGYTKCEECKRCQQQLCDSDEID